MELLYSLDFETYYSKGDVDIKTLGMWEYTQHPEAKITSYATCPPGMDISRRAGAIIAHNAQFDALVHQRAGYPEPEFWVCTKFLARLVRSLDPHFRPDGLSLDSLTQYLGIGKKGDLEQSLASGEQALREYNQQDADLAFRLFRVLMTNVDEHLSRAAADTELKAINWTVKALVYPKLMLDREYLQKFVDDAEKERRDVPAEYRSTVKFAKILEEHGVELLRTEKGNPSVASDFLDELAVKRPDLAHLIEKRRLVASNSELTKAKKFLAMGVHMPVNLSYFGAHTGRWSGAGGWNQQAMARGGAVRNSIIAPEGHTIVAADLKQIEARVLAAWCGQTDLLTAMLTKDVYVEMASLIFGVPESSVTPEQRHIGKQTILGCGYGMGVRGAVKQITPDRDLAERAVSMYRARSPKIVEKWNELRDAIYEASDGNNLVFCIPFSERAQIYRDVRVQVDENGETSTVATFPSESGWETSYLWHGTVAENIVQAASRDIFLGIMRDVAEETSHWPSLIVHDELVYCIPDEEVDDFTGLLSTPLTPFHWVELKTGCGKRYGECK